MMRLYAIAGVVLALVLVLLTAFTGNSDSIDAWNVQDNAALPAGKLDATHSLGQIFRARTARLCAIQVRWIVSSDIAFAPTGRITLHVRHHIEDTTDLATASLAMADLRNDDYSKFVFAPIANSADATLYFFLDASNAGIQRGYLSVWSSAEDDYPDGALIVEGQPVGRDLVFRTFYDPDASMLWQALLDALHQYLYAIPFVVIIIGSPGLIFLLASGELAGQDLAVRFAWASGMGLSALSAGAFLLMWLDAMTNTLALYFLSAVIVAGLGWLYLRRKKSPTQGAPAIRQLESTSVALFLLAATALGVALLQIRDVRAPLWVDSPVHASYIASLVEQAQMPLDRFYHLGYHGIVALVVRAANISIPEAMLLIGQLLIVQTGLSVFLLSRRLSGSALAGLASAVAVWFLSPTPAYFVTWGRYPLLLGCTLLPIAMLCAMNVIDLERLDAWKLFLAGLTFIGLAFAQVRLSVFYFAFVIVYAANFLGQHRHAPSAKRLLNRIAFFTGCGIGLAVLWMVALLAHGSSLQSIIDANAGAPLIDLSVAVQVISSHHGIELMGLATLALLFGLLRRQILATTVSSWYIGVCLLSVISQSTGGRPYFEPSLVVLMVFLPATLVVGDLAQGLSTNLANAFRPRRISATAVSILLISMVGLAGIKDMLALVNPATILFFDADQNAMQWIDEHLPANAKFLINSYAWFDSTYVPADGGNWIPFETGRAVDFISTDTLSSARNTTEIARWMIERKITFVYLGRRAGILSQSDFTLHPEHFTLIYDRDGVQIFQMRVAESGG